MLAIVAATPSLIATRVMDRCIAILLICYIGKNAIFMKY